MPAVPPCLTEKIRSLCRVPSHSLPVTPASRLGYLANTVHLALGGPFTETASIRITPPRTLWETVPQFYFLVFGLFLFIWYGHILPFVFCAVNYFLKTFLCFFTNCLSEAVFIYIHKAGHKACLLSGFFTAACNLPAVIAVRMICMTVKRP